MTAKQSYEAYIRESAVSKTCIDNFLNPEHPTWAQYNNQTGYTLGNYMPRDGMDGCNTLSTSQGNKARTQCHYTDKKSRINTYGNSFTQCHQVSDGETWQEQLAAHFGEPIQNFGMGGYGVFQSYRRMLTPEATTDAADNIVWYIWGDDHLRSVMRARYAAIYKNWDSQDGRAFHNNFWCNYEMDLQSGTFVEHENLLSNEQSLYKMCDADAMWEMLHDDLMVQMHSIAAGFVDAQSVDLDRIDTLADILQAPPVDRSDENSLMESMDRLCWAYGFAATKEIIDKAVTFAAANGKKITTVLFCPTACKQVLAGEPRHDQEIADYCAAKNYSFFDMNLVHAEDYKAFSVSIEGYMKRYFIGHYNPAGNHFFAMSFKDHLLEMLEPKPITYQFGNDKIIRFQDYLTEGTEEI
ncbi:MAG: hypothetical protein HRU15_17900 [Planctomycetes bacterium]|nr:hypothetical protein [Planctomycetota bacterium]